MGRLTGAGADASRGAKDLALLLGVETAKAAVGDEGIPTLVAGCGDGTEVDPAWPLRGMTGPSYGEELFEKLLLSVGAMADTLATPGSSGPSLPAPLALLRGAWPGDSAARSFIGSVDAGFACGPAVGGNPLMTTGSRGAGDGGCAAPMRTAGPAPSGPSV